jgi:hypothetical protein
MNDVGLPGERRGGLAEQGGNTRQQAETDGIVGPVLAVGIEIGVPGRSNSAGQSSSKSGSPPSCAASRRQAGRPGASAGISATAGAVGNAFFSAG